MRSVSYSAGLQYANPEIRDRQVGSGSASTSSDPARLPRPARPVVGKNIYFAFNVLRIPYTQVSMYYGLDTQKWSGPASATMAGEVTRRRGERG